MNSLIVFDLDGTLAESKSDLNARWGAPLQLPGIVDVAIISGGTQDSYRQFVR